MNSRWMRNSFIYLIILVAVLAAKSSIVKTDDTTCVAVGARNRPGPEDEVDVPITVGRDRDFYRKELFRICGNWRRAVDGVCFPGHFQAGFLLPTGRLFVILMGGDLFPTRRRRFHAARRHFETCNPGDAVQHGSAEVIVAIVVMVMCSRETESAASARAVVGPGEHLAVASEDAFPHIGVV